MLLAALCAMPALGSRSAEPSGEIVFASERDWTQAGEIYLGRPGAAPVDLSKSPFADSSVAVSPRGREIAFWSVRTGHQQLYLARTDGSRVRPIAGSGQSSDQFLEPPVFSPDGRTLTFARVTRVGAASERYDVLRADVASARAQRIFSRCTLPEPSPYNLLVACRPGRGRIEVHDAAGRRILRTPGVRELWSRSGLAVGSEHGYVTLYDTQGKQRHRYSGTLAGWSPNGRLLALGRKNRLVLQTVGGAARTVYAHADYQAQVVDFSPDGKTLSFVGYSSFLVTPVAGGKLHPVGGFGGAWSPDGRHYASFRIGTPPYKPGAQLRVTIGDRYGAHPVVVGRVLYDDHGIDRLAWLPDGSGIVYETSAATAGSDLYAVSADGTGLRRLTSDPRDQADPSWSPDGRQLAYAQANFTGHLCEGCSITLWRADGDAANPVPLTTGPDDGSFDSRASWSPAGNAVAFTHATFDSREVDVVRLDGSPPTTLGKTFGEAAWAPDGQRLAVTDQRGIESVPPTGGGARLLVPMPGVNDVAWSPDGHTLAFTTGSALLVAPADGGASPTRLLRIAGPAHPTFSPDGRWIAFSATGTRPGVWGRSSRDVMIIGVDGSGVRTVAASPFEDVDPAWRP
jgi:Tol biopolymer transport system component